MYMTYEISISSEKNLVYIVLEGPYSVTLFKNLIHKLINDKEYKPEYYLLINLINVTFNPEVSDISKLSDSIMSLKEHFPGKVARIVKSEKIYNFYRQIVGLESEAGLTSNVFYDIRDAFTWLHSPK